MDDTDRALHSMLVPELVAIAVLFALLTRSLFAGGAFLADLSRPVRLAAWVVLGTDLLAPLAVYFDMRRRGVDVDYVWVHAAAIPLLNVLGVAAYLEDSRRDPAG